MMYDDRQLHSVSGLAESSYLLHRIGYALGMDTRTDRPPVVTER